MGDGTFKFDGFILRAFFLIFIHIIIVTYGACCIDDYSARALGCDLIIHYGHSCLGNLNFIIRVLSKRYIKKNQKKTNYYNYSPN
jgi:diphthamide biosynthesis enzyme Dph1/Dph2-like protein